MSIERCNSSQTQVLYDDLKSQLEGSKQDCLLPASPLTEAAETRKASNIMHKIIGGEENEDVLEAKWLHSAWTRNAC